MAREVGRIYDLLTMGERKDLNGTNTSLVVDVISIARERVDSLVEQLRRNNYRVEYSRKQPLEIGLPGFPSCSMEFFNKEVGEIKGALVYVVGDINLETIMKEFIE